MKRRSAGFGKNAPSTQASPPKKLTYSEPSRLCTPEGLSRFARPSLGGSLRPTRGDVAAHVRTDP
jgi:hypothetical protein